MRKKYIQLLVVIMLITIVLLIFVQLAWVDKALIIEEQVFKDKVNKSLFEVVKIAEEREALLQITHSSVPFGKDTSDTGSKFLFEKNFIEDEKDVSEEKDSINRDSINEKRTIYYLKGDSLYRIDAGVKDSLGNYKEFTQDDLKKRIIGNISKKTIFIQDILNRLISNETSVDKRLEAVQIKQIIANVFNHNKIRYQYFYGVRNQKNEFSVKSPGFDAESSNHTYEIQLFPNDILPSEYYLVVYFKRNKHLMPKDIPKQMVISIIITIIITITFTFIIYLILKQRKLSELKNDFINNMTHELKTPISTISLASQMLTDDTIHIDKNKVDSITKIINDESKRLEFQIEKVLQISLFEKGNIHFNIQDIDIHEIIETAVLNTDIKVKNKGGKISKELTAKKHIIKGDKLHLTNIFFNLIDNAVKYSKENRPPKIFVKTENSDNKIKIIISDNGIGINKEGQKKIFNKFYRVPTGNVHDVKGFGLGLSYVKRIVDEHSGHISVKSELNVGTDFIIYFPLSETKKVLK
ncbi:MAG: HAMP domain-containing histidine kinase [Chlorobi bacterium]|nr:HAMP domain-containing histidine kinase [Chlorobiota bacterium]